VSNDQVDPNVIKQIQDTEASSGAPAAAPLPAAPVGPTVGQAALTLANDGRVAIDPAEGQALLNTLKRELTNLQGLQAHSRQIALETKLGQTPNASKFAQFNMEVAQTGQHALLPNHFVLMQSLERMAQAVQTAMDNYNNTELENADMMKGLDR
jgi:hypothetical protein